MNYRASARKAADELRLTGTVRNLPSGDVEAVITGDIEQLQKFIEWARQSPTAGRKALMIQAPATTGAGNRSMIWIEW